MRSIISRLGMASKAATTMTVNSSRFIHTNLFGGVGFSSKSFLLQPATLRPLAAIRNVHETKAKGKL